MAERPRTIRLRTSEGKRGALAGIVTRGRRTAFHEDFYHSVLTWKWWQFFIFVAAAFLGVNAIFAALYSLQPGAIANSDGSVEDAFYFSVQTFATIGYGGMMPATRFAHLVVTVEAITGILSVALITGLTFAKFARPTARVLFSERVVIGPRNGVPHLMVRMANWRRDMVVEAQLRVLVLVDEITAEGERLRRPLEVKLVRDRNPMFILSWTAMHAIDEASPFHGPDAMDRLRAQRADIVVTFSGLDETIGQSITARYRYTLDDIVAGARFADVLSLQEDGTRLLDFGKFHDVEPLDGEPEDTRSPTR
jgi:inward rectifier potassium channel